MGTGTLKEALAWVEYCNSERATYWADRRRMNGRNQRSGVTWWALGNEMWGEGQVGAISASPSTCGRPRDGPGRSGCWTLTAKLVSCGWNGWDDWDREVIDGMADLVNLHSLHIYTGSDDYWTNVLQVSTRPSTRLHAREPSSHATRRMCANSTGGHGLPTTNGTSGTGPPTGPSKNVTAWPTRWRSGPT